jgi:cytochrome b pre-mRNA-processing protein 3
MSLLARLFRSAPDRREAMRPLWDRVVEIARLPQWYTRGGVADTMTGRFDVLTLVAALVVLRMERDADLQHQIALLTELLIADLDGQLREAGTGDVVMGKRMGKLMGVFGGRLDTYRTTLATEGDEALIGAVSRNVTLTDGADPAHVAREMRFIQGKLATLDSRSLLAGQIAI